MTCRWCDGKADDHLGSCAPCRVAWKDRRTWAFQHAERQYGAYGPYTYKQVMKAVQQIERSISVYDWREGKRPEGYDGA
jgi:hypothetical protein